MIGGKDWGGGVARDGGSQAKNIRASCIIPRCSAPWRRMTMEEEGTVAPQAKKNRATCSIPPTNSAPVSDGSGMRGKGDSCGVKVPLQPHSVPCALWLRPRCNVRQNDL